MDKSLDCWNRAASRYTNFDNASPNSRFCKEFISNSLNDVANLKILDAGCGAGEYVHLLTQKGAHVTGIDGSAIMIELAKAKYPSYKFEIVNLHNKFSYQAGEFDMVFCNLVLMDIDPIENTIGEFYRIIKSGGRFFFSIIHPAYYLGKSDRDANGRQLARKVSGYTKHIAVVQDFWGGTTHYHRPISHYLNTMSAAGFILRRMYEPAYNDENNIQELPLYLFCEFSKQEKQEGQF